jgi:hypothetical protein
MIRNLEVRYELSVWQNDQAISLPFQPPALQSPATPPSRLYIASSHNWEAHWARH